MSQEDQAFIAKGQEVAKGFMAATDVTTRQAATKALYDQVMATQQVGVLSPTELQHRWNLEADAFTAALLPTLNISDAQKSKLHVVGTTTDANHSGLVFAVSGAADKFFVLGADGQLHEGERDPEHKGIRVKVGGKACAVNQLESLVGKIADAPAKQQNTTSVPDDNYDPFDYK